MVKKKTFRFGALIVSLFMVLAVYGSDIFGIANLFGTKKASAAFLPSESISLDINGAKAINVASGNIDPLTLKEGESGYGNVVITEFNVSVASITDTIVYSTKWPYKNTPTRNGAYEYAFSDDNGGFKLTATSQSGGLEIPVNGIVVSTFSDVWKDATLGLRLKNNSTFYNSFNNYIGAVEINGTGTYTGADKSIRLGIMDMNKRRDSDESIYYNNEWGKNSAQNEFGGEIRCTLNSEGMFVVDGIRNVRDTAQLDIGAKSFVLSVHGSYRAFLVNNLFTRLGDKVNLVGMKFVDLNKSATSNLTAKNPTEPIKATDLDELNGNKYYPGFRAPDYLIYYDKDYVKSTSPLANNFPNYSGCNEWGYEILVRIDSVSGNKTFGTVVDGGKQIPNLLTDGDSFILSGNGVAEAFLTQNSLTGASVVYDKGTNKVTVTSTPLSYISTAQYRFDSVNEMMQSAIDAKYKLNYIGEGDTQTDNKWTRLVDTVKDLLGTENDSSTRDTLWGVKSRIAEFEGTTEALNVILADFNDKFLTILNYCYQIESMSYSNPIVMSIAAWHRPNATTEGDLKGIQNTLSIFKKANLNTVYLETFWNGYSMSNNSEFVDYHKDFVSKKYEGYKDYLDCFISEAHKLGIQVHAWVEDFFVGYENYPESNVLTGKKPNSNENAADASERASWVIRDYQNNEYTQFEGGKYKFIDPSNPAVREFLKNYYTELLTRYDLDGLNLDYIRYPVQNTYGYNNVNTVPFDHGYSEYSAAKFLKEQGYAENKQTLATLRKDLSTVTNFESKAKELKAKWDAFKTKQITEFVGEINEMVKGLEKGRNAGGAKPSVTDADKYSHTDIIVSTAIFAGTDALIKKNQDWESWVKAGYIEVTTPMAYYTNKDTVTSAIKGMINKINGVAYNYAGIAPYFMGLAPVEEVYQALASLKGGAFGTVIFDSKSLLNSPSVVELLSNGIYSNASVLPHEETSVILDFFATEMKSRAELYEISGKNLTTYTNILDDLKNTTANDKTELLALLRKILALQESTSDYSSGYAASRISEELENLYNVLSVKYKRMTADFNGGGDEPVPPTSSDDTSSGNEDTGSSETPKRGCGSCAIEIGGALSVMMVAAAAIFIANKHKSVK